MTAPQARRPMYGAAVGIAIAVLSFIASAQDPQAGAAQKVAREWLALTDANKADASFDAAGKQFQRAMTKAQWNKALEQARVPFGALEQRTAMSSRFEKSLPGAPDGEYAIVVFRTGFQKKSDAQETVTLARESDGNWRVVGYFIR